jgi:large subunit ribosomal protein L24
VFVRSGRDAGKSGKVKRVMHKQHRLVVTGLNSIKRAVKPTEATVGGIIAVESPIHYSRVSLVDPSDGCVCAILFVLPPLLRLRLLVWFDGPVARVRSRLAVFAATGQAACEVLRSVRGVTQRVRCYAACRVRQRVRC